MHTKPSKSNLIYLNQKTWSFRNLHHFQEARGTAGSLGYLRFSRPVSVRSLFVHWDVDPSAARALVAGRLGLETAWSSCLVWLVILVAAFGLWLLLVTCTREIRGNEEIPSNYGNSAIFLVICLPVMVIMVRLPSYWWWFGWYKMIRMVYSWLNTCPKKSGYRLYSRQIW